MQLYTTETNRFHTVVTEIYLDSKWYRKKFAYYICMNWSKFVSVECISNQS